MRVKNKTKNTLLAHNAIEAKTWTQKTLGLTAFNIPQTMIFKTRFGIHTIGMHFPIDVIVLNKQNKVVALKKNLKPNQFFLWHPKYNTIIELPPGTLSKTGTVCNDLLEITSTSLRT